MPAATARLQLPYPIPDDTVDVPRDVQALAAKLDPSTSVYLQGTAAARPAAGVSGRLYFATDTGAVSYDTGTAWINVSTPSSSGVPLVTSLPSSPVDGQEVYYQNAAMAATANGGSVWHLRYRAGSASIYKWECVGGTPFVTANVNDANTAGAGSSWSAQLTDGTGIVGIDIPLAGDYWCTWNCHGYAPNPGAVSCGCGLLRGGVDNSPPAPVFTNGTIPAQYYSVDLAGSAKMPGCPVARLNMAYQYQSIVHGYRNRQMSVIPIRVQ